MSIIFRLISVLQNTQFLTNILITILIFAILYCDEGQFNLEFMHRYNYIIRFMKKLTILLASAIISTSALAASDVTVKLEGAFDFQAAARKQKNLTTDNNLTTNQKNSAFFTQSSLRANVTNETDYGMKYGAVITVKATSRTKIFPGSNGSHLFVAHDFGKLELGSRQNAPSVMSQSAYSICMATCDDWTRYASGMYDGNGLYNVGMSDYGPIYSGFGSNANSSEQIRTATYYTPAFNGLQLGFSYSPDTANAGDNAGLADGNGVNATTLYDKSNNYAKLTGKTSVKNLVGAGVTFSHNLGEGFDVVLGAGLEQGKAAATVLNEATETTANTKLANHKLYNVGAVVSYGNWSVAGSYADAGKSLTSANYQWDKRKNKLYTGGVAYNQGPVGVSLTYLHNDKLQNKMDSYTLGTQYKLAPGLMPYFEATAFNLKGKGYDMSTSATPTLVNKKFKGTVYMFGTRVSF